MAARLVEDSRAGAWPAAERLLRSALLAGFAALMVKLIVTGQMAKYMNTSLDALSLLAALVLAAMALVELRAAFRHPAVDDHDHDHEDGHDGASDHEDAHRDSSAEQTITYLLLGAIVALGLFVPPRALGNAALGGEDLLAHLLTFNRHASPAAAPAANPDEALPDVPALLGYLGSVGEAGIGQRARVVGLVAKPGQIDPASFVMLRYSLVHCVADARPVGFMIANADLPLQVDQWVEVEGRVAARELAGDRFLTIEAERITPVPEPADPYIHPPF